jgi:hypothetical protein
MTAILSFLGSAVFRWALEKVFGLFERRQDHAQELELRDQQERIDSAAHVRNLELMERQTALKVQMLQEQHRGEMGARDADAFIESIKNSRPTGNATIDAWNGGIRPFVASVCVLAWLALVWTFAPDALRGMDTAARAGIGVMMIEFSLSLIGSVLGWYFGARSLMPGKK